MGNEKYLEAGFREKWTGSGLRELEAAMRERLERVDAIKDENGGSFENLKGEKAGEFRRIHAEIGALGDIWDKTPVNPIFHPGPYDHRGGDAGRHEVRPVPGIADAFLRGVKAIDGTSGGTLVPAFFDPRLRELPQRDAVRPLADPDARRRTRTRSDYIRQTVATQNAARGRAERRQADVGVSRSSGSRRPSRRSRTSREAIPRQLLTDYDGLARLPRQSAPTRRAARGGGPDPERQRHAAEPARHPQHVGDPDAGEGRRPDAGRDPEGDQQDPAHLHGAGRDRHAPERLGADRAPAQRGRRVPVGQPRRGGRAAHLEQARRPVAADRRGDGARRRLRLRLDGVRPRAGARHVHRGRPQRHGGAELFMRNEIRFRGESRIGFAVSRPTAFATVTGI